MKNVFTTHARHMKDGRTLRVPVEEMLPLERAAHEVGVDCHGLKCDTKDCGWSDMTVPLDMYAAHLTTHCPECGAHVLTMQDFVHVMSTIFSHAAEVIDMTHPSVDKE